MLMTRDQEQVVSGGLSEGNAFSIAASAKAFEVLSSNLYQNKILAVIREITCNAADAHTAAGLPLSDIKVHLPTYAEPFFSVRDYGSGLPPEQVRTLYTTYFQSTKDQDNTQIGGFGLGSKSPFAVADQFTVVSYHGGRKMTYVCFKANGLPQIYVAGQELCERDDTGLEVKVAAKAAAGSVMTWHHEAKQLFRWWPEVPALNVQVLDGDHVIEPDNKLLWSDAVVDNLPAWTVFRDLPRSYVIMGNVPYSLDLDAIPDLPEQAKQVLARLDVAVRVPMGAVAISPSRETLSYDVPTCKYLTDFLSQMVRDIVVQFEQELAGASTLAEAREWLFAPNDKSFSFLLTKLKDHIKPRWNGQFIKEGAKLDLKADFSVPGKMMDYVLRRHCQLFRREGDSEVEFVHMFPRYRDSQRVVLWAAKLTPKVYSMMRHNYRRRDGQHNHVSLHVLWGMPYQELVAKCVEAGIPRPIDIEAELEEAPKFAGKTGGKLPATQYYNVTFDRGSYSYHAATAPLDLEGGGIYVPFQKGKPHSYGLLTLLGLLSRHDALHGMPRIIGLPEHKLGSTTKLVKGLAANDWQPLGKDYIQSAINMDRIADLERGLALHNWMHYDLSDAQRHIIMRGIEEAGAGTMWPGFDLLQQRLLPHFKAFAKPTVFHYSSLGSDLFTSSLDEAQLKQYLEAQGLRARLNEGWQHFTAHHPMLAYVAGRQAPTIDELRTYINR